MKTKKIIIAVCIGLTLASAGYGASKTMPKKKKILVISSYHREYLWSQDTNEGFCAAMLRYGYFDTNEQVTEYTKNDFVETSKAVVKKLWMDSKRKSSNAEKKEMSVAIYRSAKAFKPDLIFLGDDNAARYIGNKLLDTDVPVVFWGVNNTPVKYGLVESQERPGHNVTGIYQSTYYVESLTFLKTIQPNVKTFAVLSDNTPTGRSHYKAIRRLGLKGRLPLTLVETIATSNYEDWKQRVLELQNKVDAFYIASYAGLKDNGGNPVPDDETALWYITHIKIPETSVGKHFVQQGMLCSADDSAYNQSYEAVVVAHDILAKGANPAVYPPRTPKRGALMVNRQRAKSLGIALTKKMGIEEYIETGSAQR